MIESKSGGLTREDVRSLNTLLDSLGQHVRWMDGVSFTKLGVARQIVKSPDDYGMLNTPDIRDGHVRITCINGFDVTIPVTEVMAMIQDRTYVIEASK